MWDCESIENWWASSGNCWQSCSRNCVAKIPGCSNPCLPRRGGNCVHVGVLYEPEEKYSDKHVEIPLFYDKHVEVKFSDRAGPGSHNGYTRGFPTNGVYTLKLQMESANLSSTTDESRVQLMSLEYNWGQTPSACWSLGFPVVTSTGTHRSNGGSGGDQKDIQNNTTISAGTSD